MAKKSKNTASSEELSTSIIVVLSTMVLAATASAGIMAALIVHSRTSGRRIVVSKSGDKMVLSEISSPKNRCVMQFISNQDKDYYRNINIGDTLILNALSMPGAGDTVCNPAERIRKINGRTLSKIKRDSVLNAQMSAVQKNAAYRNRVQKVK